MSTRKDFENKLIDKYSKMHKPKTVSEFKDDLKKKGFVFQKNTNVIIGMPCKGKSTF